MNDDPGPSSATRQLPRRSDGDVDAASEQHDGGPGESGGRRPVDEDKRRQGLAKKLEFISHLQKSLDMMVVVYICTLYSMECSFFRFLLRLLPHYSFLTPKDGLVLPAEQPHIYSIFVPGVLCMLAHILFALPTAGEAARGYLHGGVIVDFIGQKPPTTKLAFVYFDLAILGTQCLMLAVHREREKLKKIVSPSLRTISPSGGHSEGSAAAQTTQDLDAEERGVLRVAMSVAAGGGTELLSASESGSSQESGGTPAPGDSERTGDTYSSATASVDLLDMLRSGNALLSNFHVIDAVRSVGSGGQNAAAYSLRTLGYSATLAALAAERRSRLVRDQRR
ncbi:d202442e-c2b3-480a-99dd-7ca3cd80fa52 [Thermothielavioides terrestris]|uniref:DUF1746 domain-containing protein n=2 Tax=Thermothielavioides terrestris TaxID=2587410 RepID=G2QY46_THETT|nr:uncharacterized protein THITE_2112233 [Thermothielavioides terrestris NRRL 8126]AEO65340.1 hypothetical protein THITE_2112233 [Thermothielavioides terrestris NRRL 8126]SPQ19404.1 d202442e-c2b3-480a-99dd-7ca3cd80fa52 [Thermothielavioides terrestris]